MINHERKFVFVHINKTGGTSIRNALHRAVKDCIPKSHMNVREYIRLLGEKVWEDYFTFSIVRNPWDKMLSFFFNHMKWHIGKEEVSFSKAKRLFNDWINLELWQWLEGKARHPKLTRKRYFTNQIDSLRDKNGVIRVNYVGRFEIIESTWQKIRTILCIDMQLPHLVKTQRGDYRDYYGPMAIKAIEDLFMEDIKYFNYKFR